MNEPPESEAGQRGRLFVRLYMAMQRRLYGYIASMIPDFTAVDDILHETVMIMWQEFDHFEQGTDFSAWCLAIARNQVFKHIKFLRKQKRYFSLDTMHAIEATAKEHLEHQDDRLLALRHCVKKLSRKDIHLLSLRYEIGATLKNVAKRTGQNLHTIYHRLYKLRIGLLECVERELAREAR